MRLGTFVGAGGAPFAGELEGALVHRLEAADALEWLRGEGRSRTGEAVELSTVRTLAPVPEPPSVRDFYSFEGHVAAGARRRGREVAPHWYEAPAFYFTNPAAIVGPGEPVRRPPSTAMLDFELEIAAVIGVPVGAEGDGLELAAFTLMNDWSARDLQADEVTVGLGPAKAKDFATSLGPWLVTPDELPYEEGRLRISVTAAVNGELVTTCDASEQHFGWPEIVAHAARDTRLRAGDVLGSGTHTGGCLLELGPLVSPERPEGRWIEPGDVVSLAADELGNLTTPVV